MGVRLEWEGKPQHVERLSLPFQTVETVNESRATRERETGSLWQSPAAASVGRNQLIWGDNKLVMTSLLRNFAGAVRLVYIDPPFDTGTDFSFRVQVGDADFTKAPSILEESAYRDTWGRGRSSYLEMLYERIVLIHELLADDGSLFLHLGSNVSHYGKVICDEVFGSEAYVNEIIWKRQTAHSDVGQGARHLGRLHDSILLYRKAPGGPWKMEFTPYDQSYVDAFYKHVEPESGRRYRLSDTTGPGGAAKGNPRYEFLGVTRYWRFSENRMRELHEEGRIVQTKPGTVPAQKRYLDEMAGVPLQDIWMDVAPVQAQSRERLGYDTQKPEALLERIINLATEPGDLVADFFAGSGTTAAVAEKTDRRWIACDLGRFAIHTTRKRLLNIPDCRPFDIKNLGAYERQRWQQTSGNGALRAYLDTILAFYRADPVQGFAHLHGRKAGRMVHVGATDAPVTIDETEDVMDEMADNGIEAARPARLGVGDGAPRHDHRARAAAWARPAATADPARGDGAPSGRGRCGPVLRARPRGPRCPPPGSRGGRRAQGLRDPEREPHPGRGAQADQQVVRPDRLLGGRLRFQRRGLPQPVAGLPHARGAGAGHPERLARVPRTGALRHRREDHRHLRQRHDQARRSPHQVSVAAAPGVIPGDPYAVPERRKPSDNTYVVNGVRARVDAWRAQGYPGASATTKRLLAFWFADEHRIDDGRPFRFYFCQREAVETFIYLTEIEPVRKLADLLEYADHGMLIEPGDSKRPRLAMKMATGSGKTMAMSLAIVWSYFHALREPASPMTTAFLVIAPNVIVFERLKADFGDAATFRRDPLIPPEWTDDFELTVILQVDVAPVTTRGVLYLTNVHRLYEAPSTKGKAKTAPNPVEAMLGPRVNRDVEAAGAERLLDKIATHGRVMVVNDEAHHVHDQKLEWNRSIERLHEDLARRAGGEPGAGVISQLDFSATPKYEKGGVFKHVVVDYPLAQAVADGIVKTPVIGEVSGAKVELGDTSFARNRQWLDVAVGRWRKFDEKLSPSGKRPVLFVMCEDTQAADEAGDYLKQLPDFGGDRLLVIHTNRSGEITKDDLDIARRAAREVDAPDSSIRCIVSVLMLREGWDVRNVCVIVTLRALTAANKILPEQALGRGLRRMTPPGSGFDERVVVIEHEAFRNLWSAELDGGLIVEREDADKIEPGAVTVFPDEGKRRFDIVIPQLTRALARADSPLARLEPGDVPDPKKTLVVPDLAGDALDEYVRYRGVHLIDQGVIEEYEFVVPYAEDPSGVISYYTRSVAKAAGVERIAGTFATLAPMVRDYLRLRVFEEPVELDHKAVLRRLAERDAQALVVGAFREAIGELSITQREPTITDSALRVSETPPFPWSRATVDGKRTVFNITPIDSSLEGRFAEFLDRAVDVTAWAKLTQNSRFALEYISKAGALRPAPRRRQLPDRGDEGAGGSRRGAEGPPGAALVPGCDAPGRPRVGLREGAAEAL